jgi:ankyrin repeat protein
MGNEAVIRTLLWKGANIKTVDRCGRIELHFATLKMISIRVKLLLEGGAKVSASDDVCHTALHYAVLKWHKVIIAMLSKSIHQSGSSTKW